MSYAVSQPPPTKPRPSVITIASALLYLSAALLLVSAAIGFIPYADIQDIVRDYYANQPDGQQAATVGATIGIIVTGVIYLLFAVGLVVLGVLVGKGKQAARVVTWVIAGLSVLCLGCGVVASAASSSIAGMGGTESQDLIDRIAAATPAWVNAVSLVLQVVALIAMVTVIVLLAMPAANDFFRKEQEVWVPPTDWNPGAGYPQLPPPAVPPYNQPPQQ